MVRDVFSDEKKDGRLELVHILMSVSAQVCIDMEMSKEEFMELVTYIFSESETYIDEEVDITRLN